MFFTVNIQQFSYSESQFSAKRFSFILRIFDILGARTTPSIWHTLYLMYEGKMEKWLC